MTIVLNGTTGITSPAETVGSTITYADTGILATYASSSTSYNQVILQNSNSGTASSTDVIVSNDQGTASTYYGDFGMNSSGWTGSLPFSAANVVYLTSTSGPLSLGSVTSNPVYIATNSTTAVTIDTSQNVGIGTSSPNGLIDVTSNANSTARYYFRNTNAGTGAYTILDLGNDTSNSRGELFVTSSGNTSSWGSNSLVLSNSGAYPILFSTNNAERARIDSSGNLLVGTTSTISGTYTPSVQIVGNYTPLVMRSSGATSGYWWRTGPDTSNSYIVANQSGAGAYITNGSTSWSGYSDENLKNITGTIQNGLQKVSTLRAAEFTWKSDESNKPQVGLIAQDLQKVLPEVVDVGPEGHLGVRYSEVVPLLVAAIQELNATITDLQAKLKSAGVAGF